MKTTADQLTDNLLQNLWQIFRRRVPCTRKYLRLVESQGGRFVMDHLAFRTLKTTTGEQPSGIMAIRHLMKSLHYMQSGSYHFDKQMLSAVHFEHRNANFPKIFVSQLEVNELPEWAQYLIHEVVDDTPYLLSDRAIELMNYLEKDGFINEEAAEILTEELTGYFRRPWNMPSKGAILKVNDISQYAAWVLLHGNSVSHISSLVNAQSVADWPDLESTVGGLLAAGFPLKGEIAGEKGSLLRQAATFPVRETYLFPDREGDFEEMDWTYAYFQLTERGYLPGTGNPELFRGFLEEHNSQWFKITLTREN